MQTLQGSSKTVMAGATGQVAGAIGLGAGAARPEAGANLSDLPILSNTLNAGGAPALTTGPNLTQSIIYGTPLKERVRKPKRGGKIHSLRSI